MSDAYDGELQQLAMDVGQELGYGDFLKEGVYCVLGGPSFETIAECRMLHRLGADAVGEYFFGLLGSWNNSMLSLLSLTDTLASMTSCSSVFIVLYLQLYLVLFKMTSSLF